MAVDKFGQMLICSCNIISIEDVRETILEILTEDEWQLIVPLQVYHRMGKRGKCCGCFPGLVDLIVETTEKYHQTMATDRAKVVELIDRLKKKHEQCETARLLARKRMQAIHAA